MHPAVRKLVLVVHLVCSVGWIGAVIAYLALDVAAVSGDQTTMHAAWTAMSLVGSYVLIPLAVGALLTGVIISLGTPWGLFRHYWVLISLILTTFATIVLVAHMPDVNATARMMAQMSGAEHGSGRGDFLHAGGGLVVLLFVAVLNIYKPRGMTKYGWDRRVRDSRDR
jgi:putative copper export protein